MLARKGRDMRFDVYGRFQLDVLRRGSAWVVYQPGHGKRRLMPEIVIPPTVESSAIAGYLDDLLHELALPGKTIRRLD